MGLSTRVVRGNQAERLLLLMHGLGSDENDLAGLASYLDPDGHFVIVCPRAPYSFGPGFAWYKIDQPELVKPTMRSSLDAIEEIVAGACDQYGTKREEMIAGGFSMGGAMALGFSFEKSEQSRPAGVLVMSSFLGSDPDELDWSPGSDGLPPVLMQHGTSDPMVPLERARYSAGVLREHNVPLVFKTYPMEHNVTPQSLADAKVWLDQIRAGERPDEPEAEEAPPVDEGPVKTVTATTFDDIVLKATKPVIVDFWAPWCGPCRAVAPVIAQIATMRKDSYLVVKLNIDEAPDIAQRYNVQSIPMIGLFRNGRLERSALGAKPRPQLEAELGMLVIP